MSQDSKMALGGVLLLGILLQLIMVAADTRNTPTDAAIAFSKAYFGLCPELAQTMANNGVNEDEIDVADAYLHKMYLEAAARGYELKRLRKSFSHIHTKTIAKDANTATIHISGQTRTIINPVFGFVGKIFFHHQPHRSRGDH